MIDLEKYTTGPLKKYLLSDLFHEKGRIHVGSSQGI